jgi:DNA-binding transcriptional LysR family regulator
LRVVAALAQHGTVSAASAALHLTQSAVSKQLKSIEALVGTLLFDRTSQGLTPTEAGVIYIEQARIALGALETAAVRVAALRRAQPAILVHVLPIIGDRWFIPRFSRFAEQHPEIEVEFTTYAAAWKADYLLGRDVVLVGAPQLIDRGGGINSIEDIRRFPALEHRHTPLRWNDFAQASHLHDFAPVRITRFAYYSLVIRAAIGGQGFALVPRSLIPDEIESGQLINPLGLGFQSRNCYWLTTPATKPVSGGLMILREWLLQEARQTESREAGIPQNANS